MLILAAKSLDEQVRRSTEDACCYRRELTVVPLHEAGRDEDLYYYSLPEEITGKPVLVSNMHDFQLFYYSRKRNL